MSDDCQMFARPNDTIHFFPPISKIYHRNVVLVVVALGSVEYVADSASLGSYSAKDAYP